MCVHVFATLSKLFTILYKYIEILDAKLPSEMSIHTAMDLQQDEAPFHTAKVVQKWFKGKKINVIHPT